MSPDAAKSTYRRMLDQVGEEILVRRYTGTGSNRPKWDVAVQARVVDFEPQEIIGTIVQGDRKIIALADDLLGAGLSLPITTNDKIVVRGKELAIMAADDSTRRVNGVLVAIEIQCRG